MNPTNLKAVLVIAVTALVLIGAGPASTAVAAFEITAFDGEVLNEDGSASSQAGAHPFEASATIELSSHLDSFGLLVPDEEPRDVTVELPPGLVGNPTVVARCTEAQLTADRLGVYGGACPADSMVGVAHFKTASLAIEKAPLFSMIPQPGSPATFGFRVGNVKIHMNATVRTGSDYGLNVDVRNISQAAPLTMSGVTFWGDPFDQAHDDEREELGIETIRRPPVAFLTNPTACPPAGVGLETRLRVRSWQGGSAEASFVSHDVAPNEEVPLGPTGCGKVPFEPNLQVAPTNRRADAPTGLQVELTVPAQGLLNPDSIAQANLKEAVVTLPEGMAVNPAVADGLGACTAAQIEIDGPAPARCPDSARLGTVSIATPLLDHPLEGSVYLAAQRDNPFASLLAMYLAVDDPRSGVVLKLAGHVASDPSRGGRLTTTFDDNPQIPFASLTLRLKDGPRAPLVNPPACGSYAAEAELSPWSGTPPVRRASGFQITSGPDGGPCPAGGFAPELDAGTTNPLAGAYSPFVMRLTRADGSQRIASLTATLPPGLTGKLRGIPYCPEPALAAIPTAEGTGAGQVASPSCPAASQVGTVSVGAGAGATPFHVNTGKAYLAGPYKGAPLSLAFVTPALAGPFDLGSVVVRAALRVDPESARITALSDPLPQILHGIPLNLREVRVDLDRPEFTLNPTSCDPMAISGSATSTLGAVAPLREPFQAGSCERLKFRPKLAMRFFGKTHRSAYPKLRATLTMPAGGANIAKAVVTMPKTQFLENAHIRTVCTRVQYAARACPKGSVYGYAKAWTPLLDEPLQGPVYLRSSNHELPDLVASLDGQIHIDLPGRIDSVNERLRNTFWAVPDAPVSKFVLTMQGGRKGLLTNNTELCAAKPRVKAQFEAQNGKRHESTPRVRIACGKKEKKK